MADVDTPPFLPPDDDSDDYAEEAIAVSLIHSPPRKRPRTQAQDLDVKKEEMQEEIQLTVEPVRDSDYYLSDGSCILRVGNTLFNVCSPILIPYMTYPKLADCQVHRTMLSRDSSFFGDMFAVPQAPDSIPEGSTDDRPIVLRGDNVAAFKNFLWVIYAL